MAAHWLHATIILLLASDQLLAQAAARHLHAGRKLRWPNGDAHYDMLEDVKTYRAEFE
jgi:hypothetical protein